MARLVTLPSNELNAFDLPPVCIVTGSTEGVVFKKVKFSWYPRWIGYLAPIALIVAVILMAVMTRRVSGELPFTEKAWSEWRRGKIAMSLSLLGAVALFFGGLFAMEVSSSLFFTGLLAAIALPITVGVTLLKGRGPVVQKITEDQIVLKLPSDAAAEAIQSHLVAGAHQPAIHTLPGAGVVQSA